LVDPGLAQLLHQPADVVRPRRHVQYVGRRRQRQDPRNLIGEVDRAAGVDVVPDDDAAELGVALAEITREKHRVVGRVIEEQPGRLRLERAEGGFGAGAACVLSPKQAMK
jgi:hypothetical protein